MFSYQVYTEEQAMQERYSLMKPGIYDAVIVESEDKNSKSGNPMMAISLAVYDDNGREQLINDYLVFMPRMMWKVVHFAEAAGLMSEYENQRLCSELAINKRVKVKVGVQSGSEIPDDKLNDKPKGSKYPDKNVIEDYVKNTVNKTEQFKKELEDDDIAF